MIRGNLRRLFLCAAVASTVLSAAAPGRAAEPGVSSKEILLGSYLPLQSGLAAGAAQLRDGADAYFRYVNENGGIHGRKIVWNAQNDSYNPQQALAVVKQMVDRDGVFAVVSTLGTATGLAVLPFLVQRQVPLIAPLSGSSLLLDSKEKGVFGVAPLGSQMGASLAKYAVDELKSTRVAILFQNDQYGTDGRDGANEVLKQHGLTSVAEASYVPSDADVSSQALKLKAADPDAVILYGIPKHVALFLKEAQKLDWHPKMLAPNPMSDPIMVQLADSALDGLIINFFTALKDLPDPRVAEANKILAKYYPNTEPGYYAYQGMVGAMLFTTAAEKASPDLTRDKLIAALESLKDFETGLSPPITYSRGHHAGPDRFGFAAWQAGKLNLIHSW